MGFKSKAQSILDENPAEPKQKEELKFYLAMVPYMQGEWSESKAMLEKFLAENPDTDYKDNAQMRAINCQYQLGDYKNFKDKANAFLQTNPKVAADQIDELKLNLAMVPMNLGNYAEGKKSLEAFATESSTSSTQAWAKMWAAKCRFVLGDIEGFKTDAESFFRNYPKAGTIQKMELNYHQAMAAFHEGKWREAADQFGQISETTSGLCYRRLGSLYEGLAYYRQCQSLRTEKKDSDADAAELKENQLINKLRQDITTDLSNTKAGPERTQLINVLMESWFNKEDFSGLDQGAQKFIAQTTKPSVDWATGMMWLAVARMNKTPQDLKGAAEAFGEVFNAQVQDNNLQDHVPTKAAYWLASIAQMQGDTTSTLSYVRKIRDDMPDGGVKTDALERFKNVGN